MDRASCSSSNEPNASFAGDIDILCDELIDRWRHGDRVPVESFLDLYPSLEAHEDAAFELIYTEFLLHEELDHVQPREAFLARFPGLADRLRRQWAMHRMFESEQADEAHISETLIEGDLAMLAEDFQQTLIEELPDQKERWPAPLGYRIERVLGRGGMAVVYQACQVRLNRVVALKMIRAGAHASPDDLTRFLAEAAVIARFQHANIVQVHAIGDHDGQPFFEMEYVAGGSLASHLDGTPRLPREAARLLEIMARAIHEAHLLGIVHRDLKPANILMTADGTPKVADFGLAKLLDVDSGLTRTDSVLGSPAYMAPEQADGRARHAGPAADVYALGAIFYELLTGRPPFRAATVLETLHLVRTTEPVRPSQLVPGLARDAETIALRCLDKDSARRYASAEALADDLARFVQGDPILARPTGPVERGVRWASRNRLVASLMAAVFLLFVGGFTGMAYLFVVARGKAELANRERIKSGRLSAGLALDRGLDLAKNGRAVRGLHWMAEVLKTEDLDTPTGNAARAGLASWIGQVPRLVGSAAQPSGPIYCGAISPNGQLYAAGGLDGSVTIWNLDTLKPVGPAGSHEGKTVRDLAFHPDGSMVATTGDDGAIRLWNSQDGRPVGEAMRPPDAKEDVTQGVAPGIIEIAFHPKGERLLSTRRKNLYFWDVRSQILAAGPIPCVDGITAKAFSPDGAVLVIGRHSETIEKRDGATGALLAPAIQHPTPYFLAFSPDGQRFAAGYGDRVIPIDRSDRPAGAQIFDAKTLAKTGPPLRGVGIHRLIFSPDSQRLLVGSTEGSAQLCNSNGEPIGPPLLCEGEILDLAFSPDGQLAAISSGTGRVFLIDAYDGRPIGSAIESAGAPHIAFRSDDRTLVVLGDRTIRCLDVADIAAPAIVLGDEVRAVGFGPGGTWMTGDRSGMVMLWTNQGRAITPLMKHAGDVVALAVSGNRKTIATGGWDGMVRLWSLDGRPLGLPIPQDHWVRMVALTFAGDRVWVGCESNSSRLFTSAGTPIGQPLRHPGNFDGRGVRFVAILPDGKIAISISNDGTVGRIRTDTGAQIGDFQFYPERRSARGLKITKWNMTAARLSPDGKILMIAAGGSAHLIEAATGRDLLPPIGRDVHSCDFLPDGKRFLTGGDDRAARVWDVATGEPLGPPMEHTQPVLEVVASPDGRMLLTVTRQGQAQLWDEPTRKPIGPPRRHDLSAGRPAFSEDGRWLALAAGAATFLPVPQPETDGFQAIQARLRIRTGLRLDSSGGFTPLDVTTGDAVEAPVPLAVWHDRAARLCEFRLLDTAALWHLDRLIVATPNDWLPHARRVRVLGRLHRHDEAAAELVLAYALAKPDVTFAWDAEEATIAHARQRWPEVVAATERVLSVRPDDEAMRKLAAEARWRVKAVQPSGSGHTPNPILE